MRVACKTVCYSLTPEPTMASKRPSRPAAKKKTATKRSAKPRRPAAKKAAKRS